MNKWQSIEKTVSLNDHQYTIRSEIPCDLTQAAAIKNYVYIIDNVSVVYSECFSYKRYLQAPLAEDWYILNIKTAIQHFLNIQKETNSIYVAWQKLEEWEADEFE